MAGSLLRAQLGLRDQLQASAADAGVGLLPVGSWREDGDIPRVMDLVVVIKQDSELDAFMARARGQVQDADILPVVGGYKFSKWTFDSFKIEDYLGNIISILIVVNISIFDIDEIRNYFDKL